MKLSTTTFLKAIIVLIGAFVLALCGLLVLGITTDQTGYYRPILIGLYFPAIPFFFALYQSFRLLNLIETNQAFSQVAIKSLARIKYSAIIICALFAAGLPYIYYAAQRDDAPGVVLIGMVITFASLVIAVFAALMQKLLQNALAIKSENDLTV